MILCSSGDIQYNNINVRGNDIITTIDNDSLFINNEIISINDNDIKFSGKFNLDKLNWSTLLFLDKYKINNKIILSGNMELSSKYLLDEMFGNIDLTHIELDTIKFSSLQGNFQYKRGQLFAEKLTFLFGAPNLNAP